MVNGIINAGSAAGDLALQRRDPRVQLIDGERVEILPKQRRQRIAGRLGKEIFQVHIRIVDPLRTTVNKPATNRSVPTHR